MPLSDLATVNVTTTGAGVTRAGYGVPCIVSHTASWAERTRTYSSLSAVNVDFAANTPEYLAAAKIFAQSPRIASIMIGRAALRPTQRFAVTPASTNLNTSYSLRLAVPTGTVFTSQDATFNSGNGSVGWSPSNTWSRGDVVQGNTAHAGIYVCLGPSGIYNSNGLTGIGATMGPSGAGQAIQEGTIFWACVGSGSTGTLPIDAIAYKAWAKVDALGAPTAMATGLNNITTSIQGSAGGKYLRIVGNTGGPFFGVQSYHRELLTTTQDHADPGIATDLAAIKLESNNWYGLITLYNSEALINAAAAWVESNTKLYAAATHDSAVATVTENGSATDVGHDIKAAAYARTFVAHHPSNDEFMDAAEMGKFFAISPGGETWRMKTLAGVTVEPYTDTEVTNMKARYAHFYYDVGGRSVVGGDAKTGSGEYVDVTRFIDWYTSELQAKLANLAISSNKIPFTNAGIAMVEAKVRQQNDAGIAAGGISPDPAPVISIPEVTDISSEDKADRELSSVETEWTLAGAIHHITVSVTANV